MAGIEDLFKNGNVATGLAVGVGALVVAPLVTPVFKPIAKAVIKAGLMAYDQGRTVLADVSERAGDLVAEARQEMADETARQPQGGASERPEKRAVRASK
jgi:Protein of unknown function (DUF5132)